MKCTRKCMRFSFGSNVYRWFLGHMPLVNIEVLLCMECDDYNNNNDDDDDGVDVRALPFSCIVWHTYVVWCVRECLCVKLNKSIDHKESKCSYDVFRWYI